MLPGKSMVLEIPHRDHFFRIVTVAVTADAAWRGDGTNAEAEVAIKAQHAPCCLVRCNHRTRMRCKPIGQTLLIFPGKSAGRIRCELDVVWRIRVNEVVGAKAKLREIAVLENAVRERVFIRRKLFTIWNAFVPPERHVEESARVESTKPVIARSI